MTPAYQITLNVGEDRASARADALEVLNRYYSTKQRDLSEGMWERDPFGAPGEIQDHLGGMIEAGVRKFILRFASRNQAEQVERFTDSVWPAFQ